MLLSISATSKKESTERKILSENQVDILFNQVSLERDDTVQVILHITIEEGMFYITLTFTEISSPDYGLWEWTIKTPPLIRDNQYAQIVQNEGFGIILSCETDDTNCFPNFSNEYPQSTFQFLTLYHIKEDFSLPTYYFAAHDGEGYTKSFFHTNNIENSTSTFSISSQPRNAGLSFTNESVNSDFPVVFSILKYSNSWYTASEIYRNFVMKNADWIKKGPLTNRVDFPRWLADITVWVNSHWQGKDIFTKNGGEPNVVSKVMKNISSKFNLNGNEGSKNRLGIHWYEWDLLGYSDSEYQECDKSKACGFDTHYPQYFGARANFDEVVLELQNKGLPVAPYINGRIFDMAIDKWKIDNANLYAAKNNDKLLLNPTLNDLSLYNEEYGNGIVQAAMCPATDYWQQVIQDTVDILVKKYKVAAIYIDQIAAAGSRACYDKTHNHSNGGGNYWVTGYANMLEMVRERAGNNVTILTESNAEPFIGGVNVFLTLVGFLGNILGESKIAPIFTSIYGGFVVSAGAEFFQNDLLLNPNVFAAKIAVQYNFGAQLGWFSMINGSDNMGLYDLFMSGDFDEEISYLKLLSDHRYINKKWLTFGRRVQDFHLYLNGKIYDEKVESIEGRYPNIIFSGIACQAKIFKKNIIWRELHNDPEILVTMTCITGACGILSGELNMWNYGFDHWRENVYKVYEIEVNKVGDPVEKYLQTFNSHKIFFKREIKAREVISFRIKKQEIFKAEII